MVDRLIPRLLTDRIAWGGFAACALYVVYSLAQYWGSNPGYSDRFLILIGAGYAFYILTPSWSTQPIQPRFWWGAPLLFVGFTVFALGCFLAMQIGGPRPLLLWWLTTSLILACGGFILARLGYIRLRTVMFPLIFTLLALPIPLRILLPLQDNLQEITTSLSHSIFSLMGFTVHREEFVLALPGGKLRVEEACSGVRSVTALTAIAAFVAFWQGFGPVRGGVLFVLSIPVVAAVNVVRVVLSGLIQEWIDKVYIQDEWHEALGFAMVFVGLGLILLMANLMRPSEVATATAAEPTTPDPVAPIPASVSAAPAPAALPEHRTRGLGVFSLVVLGLTLTAMGSVFGYKVESQESTYAPLDNLPLKLNGWNGEALPIPTVVSDLLAPDVAVHRKYTNNVGQEAYVWVFYWGSGAVIRGYHHPDVCWGKKGFAATSNWMESIPLQGVNKLPVTAREYHQGRDRQIVFYWTQEGHRIWTDADERAAERQMLSSSWHGHKWVGDLIGARTDKIQARLQVVVIVPSSGPTARKDTVMIASQIADELYQLCPWAQPE